MKTLNSAKRSLMIIFAFLLVACGAETVLATIFIASFTALWKEDGHPEHTIFLNNSNPDSESGKLLGNEDLNGVGSELAGTFDGLSIEFTIKRSANTPPIKDVTYSGKMVPVSETDHKIVKINLKSTDD